MKPSNETIATIKGLAEKVKDESKPVEERKGALKLICQLRNEPYQNVPEDDLRLVVAGMTAWPNGLPGLTLVAALEAVETGKARRKANQVARTGAAKPNLPTVSQ
jgi:hypothetical protein